MTASIARVEAFRIAARFTSTYWGSRAWKGAGHAASYRWEDRDGHDYPPRWRMRNSYRSGLEAVLVRIEDADGAVGWGEAKAPIGGDATAAVVRDVLADIVLGQRPEDRTRIWEQMYGSMRLRGHFGGFLLEAMSGVDIALWDLTGQRHGVPVHLLLSGTVRESVPVYASGIPGLADDGPGERDRVAELASSLAGEGYRAMKVALAGDLDLDLAAVRIVREVAGPDIDIYVDAGGTYDLAGARKLDAGLCELGVGFLEAPFPPEHVDAYRLLRASGGVRLASDLIVQRYQALDYLRRDALDILQPDTCRSGGITETKRIADLADAFGAGFAPHLSIGTPIQLAASAHVALAVPNLVVMERPLLPVDLDDLVETDVVQRDGQLFVGNSAGLGIRVNESEVRRLAHTTSA